MSCAVDNFVELRLIGGGPFGLTSVNLADPNAPSVSPLSISFRGFRADGSMVSESFVTPGNGADHLVGYQFNSDFLSGLTRVEIDAPRWAMDDLVFTVPEPGAANLALLGLLVLGVRRAMKSS